MASRSVMMILLWIIALVFSISRSTEAQCQPKLEIRGRAEKATAMFTIDMTGTSKVGDKLPCFCNGTDVRNLTWYGPKGVLQTRAENNQVFSRINPTIDALDVFLKAPQCDDFGEYVCKYGSLTANATAKPMPGTCIPTNVTISAAPGVTVTTGDTLILSCSVLTEHGLPTHYVWLKDGRMVGSGSTYKILAVAISNNGDYTCVVKNDYGTANHSIAISVKEEFFVHWEKRMYRARESDRVINLTLVTNSTLTKSITVMAKPATIRRRSPNEAYISFIAGSPIMITYNPLRETFGRASIGFPVDPDDFRDAVYNFIFKAKAKKAQESFQIINDEVLEYDEIAFSQFSFREEDLERYDIHPTDPTVTYIIIEDDDNVMINFSPVKYTAQEDVEVVTLRIEINGQFSRPLSATVGCRDASASNVTDYIWTSLMILSFESFLGDPPLNRTFDIPIVNDDEYEDVEYFLCEILNTSLPGRFLIDQSGKQANVTITDDDFPGAPTNFMISPPSGSCDQLMVTWTAPSNTGGLPVKYKVYRNGTLIHQVISTATTTWSGLTANTQYTVRVVAFNDLGDGGEVTGTRRTRPQSPSISSLSASSSTQLIITLTAPARSSSLTYECIISTTMSGLSPKTVTDTVLQYTVNGLSPYVTYTIECTSSNGEDSCNSNMNTIRMPSDVPSGPPLNLNVRLMSDTSAILTWDQPAEKHRSGEITGYVIRYKRTTVSNNEEMITVGRGVTELELNDLITGESYHCSIAAQTINGTGPYDNVTIVVEGLPGPVLNLRTRPTDVTFKWDPPVPTGKHGQIVSYTVVYGELDVDGTRVSLTNDTTSYTISLTGERVPYYINISASTAGGRGEEKQVVYLLNVIDLSTTINTSTIKTVWSGNSLTISWEPLTLQARGFPVYYIYLNDSSGPVKREIEPIASITESSIVIGGLDSSQMYTLAIAVATNDGKLVGRVSETVVISSQPVRAQEDKGNPSCAVYIVCGLFGGVAIGAVTTVIMYKIICGVPNRYTCRKRRPTDKKRKTTQTEMNEFKVDCDPDYEAPDMAMDKNPAYVAVNPYDTVGES